MRETVFCLRNCLKPLTFDFAGEKSFSKLNEQPDFPVVNYRLQCDTIHSKQFKQENCNETT